MTLKPKATLSDAETIAYKLQLDKWVEGKLKSWDTDEAFRNKRKKKHKSRDLFEKSLRKKAAQQLQAAATATATNGAGSSKKQD